jgi:putative DNA primase/helicase
MRYSDGIFGFFCECCQDPKRTGRARTDDGNFSIYCLNNCPSDQVLKQAGGGELPIAEKELIADQSVLSEPQPPSAGQSILEAALNCARRGIPVFPVDRETKKPLGTEHGYLDATTDIKKIENWWKKSPHANLGMPTGNKTGVVVIDIDVDAKKNGEFAWKSLLEENGGVPGTVEIQSGGGGRHLYFKYPANGHIHCSAGKLGEGIDVKGDGGSIILPPSKHASGRLYIRVSNGAKEPIELPEWLYKKLVENKDKQRDPAPAVGDFIPEGKRNETLLSLAGTMRHRGMGEDAILAALTEENKTKCSPPLPEDEVRSIVKSVLRYPATQGKFRPSDLANAEELINQFGQDLHFCAALGGWFTWDGLRWISDRVGGVQRMAQCVVRSLYARAGAEPDEMERKAGAHWAIASESAPHQRAILDLGWSQEGVAVTPDVWDTDQWLFNCINGTKNLRSGEFRPHQRKDLLTKLAPVAYDPAATAPTWEAHLKRFLPNADVRRQVQRDLGMALVGATLDEVLPIWYGIGANGKSTTAQVLQRILGDYARTAAPDLLVLSRHDRHPTEIADLRGSRLIFSVEIGEARRLDEVKVKALTGGDVKKARLMHQDFFEFPQTFTLIMLTNHLPVITGTDEAIWRRIRLIPWSVRIAECDRLPQAEIVAALVTEGPGILRWLLEGLADWQQDHHWVADEVVCATNSYRADQDRLCRFLEDCCEMGARYAVGVAEFYTAYENWVEQNGEETLGKLRIGKLLRLRGIRQEPRGHDRMRFWLGLRVRTSADNLAGNVYMKNLLENNTAASSAVVRTLIDDPLVGEVSCEL